MLVEVKDSNGNLTGYSEDDGFVKTSYGLDWEITGFELLETDEEKNATAIKNDSDEVIAYTYELNFDSENNVKYVYSVDSSGNVTGYTEQFTETDGDGNSFDYTYSYDNTGNYLGYSYSDGTQTISYNAEGTVTDIVNENVVSNDDGTYTYTDAFGVTTYYDDANGSNITGYSTLYEETDENDNVIFSEIITYDASWTMTGATTVEGNTTTLYDANWEIVSTSTDFSNDNSGVAGEGEDAGLTIYTETNDWGSTKYYVNENGDLVKYEDIYTDTFTYTNWEDKEVTTTYINSQIFSANGTELGDKGSYSETIDGKTYTGSYSTINNYDAQGSLTGYTTHSEYNDQWGSGVSDMTFDANWNILTENSHGTNTWSWTDLDGIEHTETNSYSNITNEDGTHTNTWSELDVEGNVLKSETINYDANWNMTGGTRVEGAKTITFDENWEVISTSTDVSALGDGVEVTEGDVTYTVYTEINEWGDTTKYYTDSDGNLVKYEESHSGEWTYTDWQGREVTSINTNYTVFDANGNMIGDYGTNTDKLADGTIVNQGTHKTEYLLDGDGNITGYKTHNTWSDENGNSGTNDSVFDAEWNMISDSGTNTNTWSWTDPDGTQHTETHYNSYNNITNEDGTHTNTWSELDVEGNVLKSETINYDANWNMTGGTRVEGAKTITFDENWEVISTSTDVSALGDGVEVTEGDVTYTVYTEINEWGDTTKYYTDSDGNLVKYEETFNNEVENNSNAETFIEKHSNSTIFDANGKVIGESNQNSIEDTNGNVINFDSFKRLFVFDENGNKIETNEHREHKDENGSTISDVKYDVNNNSLRDTSTFTSTYIENDITYTKVETYDATEFNDTNRPLTVAVVEEVSHIENGSKVVDETLIYVDENVYHGENARTTTRTFEDGSIVTLEFDDNGNIVSEENEGTRTDIEDDNGNVIGYSIEKTYDNVVETIKYDLDDNILVSTIETTETYQNSDGIEITSITTTVDKTSEDTITRHKVEINSSKETISDITEILDKQYNFISESGTRTHTYNNGQIDVKHTSEYNTTINEDGNRITTDTWSEVDSENNALANGTSTRVEDADYQFISGNGTRESIDENDNTHYSIYDTTVNYDENNNIISYTTVDREVDNFDDANILYLAIRTEDSDHIKLSETGVRTHYDDNNDTTVYSVYEDFFDENGNVLYSKSTKTTYGDNVDVTINEDGTITASDDPATQVLDYFIKQSATNLSFSFDEECVLNLYEDANGTSWESEAETSVDDVDVAGEWYYANDKLTYYSNADSQVEVIGVTLTDSLSISSNSGDLFEIA